MRWFWKFGLSPAEKRSALDLIRHLQTMAAYQQLTMEIYNDALAAAGRFAIPAYEGLVRPQNPISDPGAVREHVIPALEKKTEILTSMQRQHEAVAMLGAGSLRPTYTDFTAALDAMQRRTKLQHDGFVSWCNDPSLAVDVTRLDFAEQTAMDKSIESLNKLIARAGLSQDDWLEINRESFNIVWETIGRPPMSRDDFRDRFLAGLSGKATRFFVD